MIGNLVLSLPGSILRLNRVIRGLLRKIFRKFHRLDRDVLFVLMILLVRVQSSFILFIVFLILLRFISLLRSWCGRRKIMAQRRSLFSDRFSL